MGSLQFKLETFEGPLDLLLHLISKHKMNIFDIEISLLLEQYLESISGIEKLDYETAADFYEMAARLIYIKTCYLLPQPAEADELKKELQGRIIEYSLCKLAAQKLREGYAGGNVFVREPVKLPVNKQYTRIHDKQELYDAYMAIYSKVKNYTPLRANMFSPIVSKRVVSVESKIAYVLERLYSAGHFDMSSLYDGMTDRSERIATFLAVLELAKTGKIYLNEDNTVITLRTDKPEEDDVEEAPPEPEAPAAEEETSAPEEVTEPKPIEPEAPAAAEETSAQEEVTEPKPIEPESPAAAEETSAPEEVTESKPIEPEAPAAAEETSAPEEAMEPKPAEPEKSEAPEKKTEPRQRTFSVQLALEAHTAALRLPEFRAVPAFVQLTEPIEEDVSLPEEPRPVFVIEEPEPVSEPAVPETLLTTEETDEEPPQSAFRANYFGRRYFWGNAPLSCGERNYRAAVMLRK